MNDEDDQKQEELIKAMKAMKKKYGGNSLDKVSGNEEITLRQSTEDVAPEVIKKKKISSPKSVTEFIDSELEKDYKRFQEKIQRTYNHERVDKMKMIKLINNFLTQYLDGYVLVGIDVAGHDLVMSQYNKQSDYRAVSHLMEDYFEGTLGGMRSINGLGEEEEYEE
jgi:hypothetical protein